MDSARISASLSFVFGGLLLAPWPAFAQLPSQQPCPRVDIIQLREDFAAINLDGYTVGHIREPSIADQFLPKRPNARVIAIKPMFPTEPSAAPEPRTPSIPHCPDVVFSTDDKTLNLGDELIARFKTFTPTEDILERVRERQGFVVGRRIKFDFPGQGAMTARVQSGPDRPQPDAGGGGGSERPIPRTLPRPGRPDTRP